MPDHPAEMLRTLAGPLAFSLIACGPSTNEPQSSGDTGGTTEASSGSTDGSHTGAEAADTSADTTTDAPCTIEDPALAAAIRDDLGLPADAALTPEVLATLEELHAHGLGIGSIAGLECATSLLSVGLGAETDGTTNTIVDLSPLAGLVQLRSVFVSHNPIVDLSPLAGLPRLRVLDIEGTQVADLSPLVGAPLEVLDADDTPVADVAPLGRIATSTSIALGNTAVVDVDVLAQLPALRFLDVGGTDVDDLSAFAGSSLESLDATATLVDTLPESLPVATARLADDGISDLAPLLTWPSIRDVDLSNNLVDDVAALADIPWTGEGFDACVRIDLRGNPLSHPDTAATLQQACAEHLVDIAADGDLGCRHEICGMPPP